MNHNVTVRTAVPTELKAILTPEAIDFIASIHQEFSLEREKALLLRQRRQENFYKGVLPDFTSETSVIREGPWKVAFVPKDLEDRRVEITGPAGDAKMVINAFNSGANVFMADFEDAQSPTWKNCLMGQLNLYKAIRNTLSYISPDGKRYTLKSQKERAVLMVRPRGWHLLERHFLINGQPISASFFDFGLFFFHNARELLERDTGPYFYLPKIENTPEAWLWNEIFIFAQNRLGIPLKTVKATVLIETILAAFEMDEILHSLKDHSAGLNCGRWDYIFSVIKKFGQNPDFLLPDRAMVTMDKDFLAAYAALLVKTCHRRGAHAMGGMAAQIPIKNDPEANLKALEKVREDKMREVLLGHDGTWVAHPGLVSVAKEIFDKEMPTPNQIRRQLSDPSVTAADLLKMPQGEVTLEGIRVNTRVGLQYIESWLRGVGCVPINNLMEDAATAEISRTQNWQWLKHNVVLSDGGRVNLALIRDVLTEELQEIERSLSSSPSFTKNSCYRQAAQLLYDLSASSKCPEFLTLPAYDLLLSLEKKQEAGLE